MIFPEGTLVSNNTQPISKKYAEKMGYVSSVFVDTVAIVD